MSDEIKKNVEINENDLENVSGGSATGDTIATVCRRCLSMTTFSFNINSTENRVVCKHCGHSWVL